MTIAGTVELPGGRRTRFFVQELQLMREAADIAVASFMDEGDREREPALREVMSGGIIYVDAHAGVDPPDLMHIYVRRSDDENARRVFACVIATEARAEKMLQVEPWIVESFSFQVSSGRFVTPAATIAAFESWFERTFPDMTLPAVCFRPVTDSVDAFAEGDLSDIPDGPSDEKLPTSFDDIASLVAA